MLLTIASAFFYTEIKSGIFTKMLSTVVKVFWTRWELHGMVGLSLCLQFVLLLFGDRRKFRGQISAYVAILVWSTYLTADWIATVALSTLLKAKEDEINNSQLVVFWTPFLLLHLGGQHTISSLTLSDNELWLRSLLGLIIQVGVAVYVYMRFGSHDTTPTFLTYMAIPVFLAGIIKYGERIWILRAASKKQFNKSVFSAPKPFFLSLLMGADPPPKNHSMGGSPTVDHSAKRLEEYLDSKGVMQEGKNIYKAFCLYKMFIPLFSDLKLRIDKDLTKEIILPSMSVEFEEAFKVVEMELGFLYDVLYTKATILRSIAGVILRIICLLSTFSALMAFSIKVGQSRFPKPDIAMTYILLIGALFLDVFAVIVHFLSNWTVLDITIPNNKVHKFIGSRRVSRLIRRGGYKKEIISMAQHSLIDYCLKFNKSRWTKILRFIDTEDIVTNFWWTTWKPVSLELKKFIHCSLKQKHDKYSNGGFQYQVLLDLLTSKGKFVLQRMGVFDEFSWSIEDVEFSHSLLLWHVATFLLFQVDCRIYSSSGLGSYCQISKLLSDYMMYLLLVRPTMLPKGIGEVRIKETREEVLRFFNQQSSQTESEAANAFLHDINFGLEFSQVQSKSVLSDGRKLACQLQALVEESLWDHEEKWKMIADVWMEMLVFAATKCEWREHASQMKNGAELLTHVGLLAVHFGLTENVRIIDGQKKEDIQSNQGEPNSDGSKPESLLRWDWELSHLAYYLA